MAKYNPFFERAGMAKIMEQPTPKQALAIREVLRNLGFNMSISLSLLSLSDLWLFVWSLAFNCLTLARFLEVKTL